MRASLSQPGGAHRRAVCRGGITDIIARGLAQRLAERWGQQVVVENKPGGTGGIGAEAVAKAAPDGYTLLITADATFVSNPHFHWAEAVSDDPLQEFAPITGLGISPQALTVNPRLPVRTLSELIALARKQPGEIITAPSERARAGTSISFCSNA